ncbi:MAG: hypothetical protein DA443_00820 [Bacteroidetes bacterium]|nr:MAG: hypothetical protein DA443_00820 [Bacteroidota bacterium]
MMDKFTTGGSTGIDSASTTGSAVRFDHPEQLEALYQKDKAGFTKQFFAQYSSLEENPKTNLLARSWHARLTYRPERITVPMQERMFIVLSAALSGLLFKLPEWTGFVQDEYMIRYFPFMILPFLIVYLLWKRGADRRTVSVNLAGIAGFVLYMSFLPYEAGGDVLPLVMMHMLLTLWFLTGHAYDGGPGLGFLRINGDVAVAAAVLGLAGGLLTMISFGLFSLTPLDVEHFFESYVIYWGGPSIALGAFFLAETKPGLVSRVAPVIARIFTPVAAGVLFLFLMAFVFTDVDLYSDRSVLFVFNLMLIAVMALTLFSLANDSNDWYGADGSHTDDETQAWESSSESGGWFRGAQILLIALALVIGLLAFSAIVVRVINFGFSPNRTIVLGSNLLILVHLAWIGGVMIRSGAGRHGYRKAEQVIVRYLPVYFYWAVAVIFLLPLLF